jgi:hypothetical protein
VPDGAYSMTKSSGLEKCILLQTGAPLKVNDKDEFEIPLTLKKSADISLMALEFHYSAESATFVNAQGPEGMHYAEHNGKIAVISVTQDGKKKSTRFNKDAKMISFRFRPKKGVANFSLNLDYSTVADSSDNIIKNLIVDAPTVYGGSIPKQYALSQNYPNPFNPSTTIEFDNPEREIVKLEISNVLGQDVRTIVNEILEPGHYKRTLDSKGLPSGVYFYRLQSGTYIETKKMLHIK